MQIDDLTLTLFSWENIPPTQYAAGSGNSSGNSTLGLLRISTDDGIEGHAFLGSATKYFSIKNAPVSFRF